MRTGNQFGLFENSSDEGSSASFFSRVTIAQDQMYGHFDVIEALGGMFQKGLCQR